MNKKSISTIFDEAPITQADIDTGKLVRVKRVGGGCGAGKEARDFVSGRSDCGTV